MGHVVGVRLCTKQEKLTSVITFYADSVTNPSHDKIDDLNGDLPCCMHF